MTMMREPEIPLLSISDQKSSEEKGAQQQQQQQQHVHVRNCTRRHAALQHLRQLVTTASSRISHSCRVRYQLLQSAAASRRLELQREKHHDRVRQFIRRPKPYYAEEPVAPSDSNSTDSTMGDSHSTLSTKGDEDDSSPAEDSLDSPVWDDDDDDEEDEARDERLRCGGLEERSQHGYEVQDESDFWFDHNNNNNNKSPRQQKNQRPIMKRLNLARKGTWKFVQDPNEIWQWQAEVENMRLHKQCIVHQRRTIHKLRCTSQLLSKPVRRGFEDCEEATSDMVMFSIIQEEENSNDDASRRAEF